MTRASLAAAGGIALAVTSPAFAQASGTPKENLDCAIWAAVASDEVAGDEEAQRGMLFLMNWFIGLYEGATGALIDQPLAARLPTITSEELDALDATCGERAEAYGNRLNALGDAVDATGSSSD